MGFNPGDAVVLRELWRGQTWSGRPVTAVEDTPDGQVFFVHAGMRWACAAGPDGAWLRLPSEGGWTLGERVSTRKRALSFAWPGVAHAAIAYWDARTDEFLCWYINLQTPLARTAGGFDYTDHVLDVIVEPDLRTHRWKDEDELCEAVARGLFPAEEANAFREEGERALEQVARREPPFDEDWSRWRPDPAWARPELPADWGS